MLLYFIDFIVSKILMNKEASGFKYFSKNCTFHQLSILRTYTRQSKEKGVFYIPEEEFLKGFRHNLKEF